MPSDVEHYLRDADDITKRKFAYLHKSFPSVKPPVLMSAISVSKGKLSFAKDVRLLLSEESVPSLFVCFSLPSPKVQLPFLDPLKVIQ